MAYRFIKRFPRLTAVTLSYLAVFILFALLGPGFFENLILPFGLIGVFIAGALYTYSFTASIGALLLISIASDYPAWTIAVVGGIGSLLSDLTIFRFVQNDLKNEVARLGTTSFVRAIGMAPVLRKRWFRDALGAFILASPLPDEVGIAIMASAKVSESNFTLIAFVADMIGIYILVSAAAAL